MKSFYDYCLKFDNKIIEDTLEDIKNFYGIRCKNSLIVSEIEYNLYKAKQIDEDDLEYEIGCTKKDIIEAEKILNKLIKKGGV